MLGNGWSIRYLDFIAVEKFPGLSKYNRSALSVLIVAHEYLHLSQPELTHQQIYDRAAEIQSDYISTGNP